MYNLQRFKYDKNQRGSSRNSRDDDPTIIPETPPKRQDLEDHQDSNHGSVRKKRKFDLSSDEDGFEEVAQKYKKTRITHFLKKNSSPEKKRSKNFISPDSGSDSENDQDSNGDVSQLATLKEMFPEFSEDKVQSARRSTFTMSGAIAILSRWKCEDIKNHHTTSPRKNDQNSQSSYDSPVVLMRRKNCLRLDSEEKDKSLIIRNGGKKSVKRLGLSSSESESEDETNSNDKSKGPFPRLSCVVTNSTPNTEEEPENNVKNGKKDTDEDGEIVEEEERNQKTAIKNGICKFYSKKDKSWKSKKDRKASKFESDTLTMDNAADENFSAEEDLDSGSSDDEFSGYGKKRKNAMLEFFQSAGMDELITMHSCSQKKAEIITKLRPFKSWDDLVKKIDGTKHINSQLIFRCADLIKERAVLGRLLEECRSISNGLASEIAKLHCHDHMTEGSALMKAPKTIPSHLQLKPYQLVGLNWLALLHRNKVNGVLADEMGLGKTVQTIAFLAHLLEQDPETGPHLIIVPSSTLDNWCRELTLWCPEMDIVVYRGSQGERRAKRVEFTRGRTTNVILTTYNSAISTPEDRLFFRKLDTQYAVFDEGHMLKNMSSQRYVNLMKIKAARKLLLTGTPLQNNLLELMSLLRFVMPHMFEQTTDTLIRIFSSSNSESSSRFAKDRIQDAKDIMQPFVLRRLKDEVLKQLPKKVVETVLCEMAESQKELYEEVRERFRLKLNKQSPLEMKNVFIELRKVANHSLLRRHHYTMDMLVSMAKLLKKDPEYHDSREHLIVEDMTVMTDFELHCFCKTTGAIRQYALDDTSVLKSGKFEMLDKLLPRFQKQSCRVLIFSQFTMIMDIIEKYLKHRKHKFLRLDGSTPVNIRLDLIDQFNSDPSILVFLLSTKAGGLGINLTAANVVILHDIDMNPYNDKQAEDRCHRLGQTRSVKILRFISKDTLEEGMLQLAENKLKLEQEMTTNEDESSDIAALLQKTLAK